MVRLISKLFSRKQDKKPAVSVQVLTQEVSDKEAGSASGGVFPGSGGWGGSW